MADPANREPRLLLVDDQPINIKILARALEDLASLSFATSGAEALRLAARDPAPDMILLDLLLPDMDGFAVCQRLRSEPATAGIPVIIVTALDDRVSQEKGLAAGAVDYLFKPIAPAIVRARVGVHIELACYRRALAALLRAAPAEFEDARAEARALLRRHGAAD